MGYSFPCLIVTECANNFLSKVIGLITQLATFILNPVYRLSLQSVYRLCCQTIPTAAAFTICLENGNLGLKSNGIVNFLKNYSIRNF